MDINAASPTERSKITSKHTVTINQRELWLRKEACNSKFENEDSGENSN